MIWILLNVFFFFLILTARLPNLLQKKSSLINFFLLSEYLNLWQVLGVLCNYFINEACL